MLLLLASASLARRRLLEQIGMPHRVMVSGFNEEGITCSEPSEMVKFLSLAKANAVELKLRRFQPHFNAETITSILGCDSAFVFEDEIFGKPKDSQQSIQRLERLSSKYGFLITGYSLLFRPLNLKGFRENNFSGLIQDVVSTRVEFDDLSTEEIEEYVSTGEPLNCAGGFALEGKGGMLINQIDGCYSNVIGLSLPWLRRALKSI